MYIYAATEEAEFNKSLSDVLKMQENFSTEC